MSQVQWSSRLGHVLAAAGTAIGLGAIWKFPYVTATNGGGAFLFYGGPGADLSPDLILTAMVAAARADGVLDAEERATLERYLMDSGADAQDWAHLDRLMRQPVDLDTLVARVKDPVTAAEVYGASYLAIDPDTAAERAWLSMLAARLGLDQALAQAVLRVAHGRRLAAVLLLGALCALLSMWMSNTATAAIQINWGRQYRLRHTRHLGAMDHVGRGGRGHRRHCRRGCCLRRRSIALLKPVQPLLHAFQRLAHGDHLAPQCLRILCITLLSVRRRDRQCPQACQTQYGQTHCILP